MLPIHQGLVPLTRKSLELQECSNYCPSSKDPDTKIHRKSHKQQTQELLLGLREMQHQGNLLLVSKKAHQ